MIGIIVLNYNTWHQTEECINSVFATLSDEDGFHIYLVDNCSQKPITSSVSQMIKNPKITFIKAEENKGYAAGNNLGLRQAREDQCDYYLITNNDIVFKKGTIAGLINDVSIGNIGMAGPKAILEDGRTQEIHLGCKMTLKGKYLYFLRKTPIKFLTKKFVNSYLLDVNTNEQKIVYGVSGCCFIMNASCFEDIGYFDEGTFLYEEEDIISVKMEETGWKTIYDPKLEVIHKHGKSTTMKAFAYSCMIESEMYYLKKYLRCNNMQVFPLLLLRIAKYFLFMTKNQEYRSYYKSARERWKKAYKANY